jgi:hypothetical protein
VSVRASTWAWEQGRERGLGQGQLLTLLKIADHADNDGVCWPGEKHLAEYTGQGETTVRGHLKKLTVAGLLHRERQTAEKGRGRARDHIFLHLDQPADPAGEKPDDQPAGHDLSTGSSQHSSNKGTVKEPSEASDSLPPPASSSGLDDVELVWSVYVQVFEKKGRGAELQPDARKIIRDALKAGDVEELVTCIRANYASDYHQKRGEEKHRKGGKYNSIGQIFKPRPSKGETQRSRIEWWLEKAGESVGTQVIDVNAELERVRKEQGLD